MSSEFLLVLIFLCLQKRKTNVHIQEALKMNKIGKSWNLLSPDLIYSISDILKADYSNVQIWDPSLSVQELLNYKISLIKRTPLCIFQTKNEGTQVVKTSWHESSLITNLRYSFANFFPEHPVPWYWINTSLGKLSNIHFIFLYVDISIIHPVIGK